MMPKLLVAVGVVAALMGAALNGMVSARASDQPTPPLPERVDIDLQPGVAALWITFADGTVEVRGAGVHHGGEPELALGESIVELAPTPSGDGYWMFSSAGRVFTFGDAVHHGDLTGVALARSVVSASVLPDGSGYYLLAADGGVFALGTAAFHGSLPQVVAVGDLAAPVVAMSATDAGYLLIAADGGTFAFGDAQFHGSVPGVLPGVSLASPVVDVVPGPAGYLMLGGDGGIFNFGVSRFHGSLAGFGAADIVDVAVVPDLSGYLMLDADGHVWPFGDARDVAVRTVSGVGPTVVPFSEADAVIVELTTGAAGRSVVRHVQSTEAMVLDGPGTGRVIVEAPSISEIGVETAGSWTLRVMPLTYAEQLRAGQAVDGRHPQVFRVDRSPAGSTASFTAEQPVAIASRTADGSMGRLLYNHLPPNGAAEAVVLPDPGGPLLLAIQSAGRWTLDIVGPELPRRVEIIGDSVGITLAVNQTSSSRAAMRVGDSSTEGCGLIGDGSMLSGGRSRRSFAVCSSSIDRWIADIDRTTPDVALLVVGAWEVFDLRIDGVDVPFGSPPHDAILRDALTRVRTELALRDVSVAFLEVACQFPRPGGGLTPLPERGERWRTDHLNSLIREVVAVDDGFNDRAQLVTSPPELCDDPAVGDNPSIRWDGTHYGPAGGALVWEHLRDQLLRMP